ncbi:MAG: DUF4239 domain-containing protein [Chthoniobacterales bacterium]|nr:DUF4239 domain-containing protein [Chthoniobacterales bacterium]
MNFEHSLALMPGLFWICLLIPAVFAISGIFLARKLIAPHKRTPHHDIAHALLGPIATVFSILGAFMVATTWHEYCDTNSNLNSECNSLRSLYFNARAFTPERCNQIQELCRAYRYTVLNHEWKIIQKGKDDLIGDQIIGKIADLYLSYPLKTDKERIYFQISVDRLDKLRSYREQRIQDSFTGLLPLLWALFLLSGASLVVVSLLMISSPGKTHAAMAVLLAMVIGAMIFAIISLDYPFVGFTKMSTTSFEMLPMEKESH